jgi:hypothetical protein
MVLDERLLRAARDSAAQLAEAERKTLLARAEHHTAVRRLHLAGGSLREIAAALAISHQRVQQIVDRAGGSWWQRIWRTRAQRDAVCSFCARPPAEVRKLVRGPDVFICDRCVAEAERALAGRASKLGSGARACSFCGKRSKAVARSADAGVCGDCLEQCRRFVGA